MSDEVEQMDTNTTNGKVENSESNRFFGNFASKFKKNKKAMPKRKILMICLGKN